MNITDVRSILDSALHMEPHVEQVPLLVQCVQDLLRRFDNPDPLDTRIAAILAGWDYPEKAKSSAEAWARVTEENRGLRHRLAAAESLLRQFRPYVDPAAPLPRGTVYPYHLMPDLEAVLDAGNKKDTP